MIGNETQLEDAFRAALGLPQGADVRRLEYGRNAKWDSVGHIQLVAAIEQAFDIILEGDDIFAMKSYAAAADLLEKKYGIASR
jgi:hypothetical protein